MRHFNGYGAYLLFLALRTHFTSPKYDFWKFHGKLRATKESYDKRPDRHCFEKLARMYTDKELKEFFIANLLEDQIYPISLLENLAEDNYVQYKRRKQSLTYTVKNELDDLFSRGIKEAFVRKAQNYPRIVTKYLRGDLSHETMVILNKVVPFIQKFDTELGADDLIWGKISLRLKKYQPFVVFDNDSIKTVFKRLIEESECNV